MTPAPKVGKSEALPPSEAASSTLAQLFSDFVAARRHPTPQRRRHPTPQRRRHQLRLGRSRHRRHWSPPLLGPRRRHRLPSSSRSEDATIAATSKEFEQTIRSLIPNRRHGAPVVRPVPVQAGPCARRPVGHPLSESDRPNESVRDQARRRCAHGRLRQALRSRCCRAPVLRAGRSTGSLMIGRTALMTSDASAIRVAPCLMRSLVPAARGSSGEPGTAKTSRPCSAAMRAVISEPDRCAASTTTTPIAAPEIRRLRRGKSRASGTCPIGISEIAPPPSSIAASRSSCSDG